MKITGSSGILQGTQYTVGFVWIIIWARYIKRLSILSKCNVYFRNGMVFRFQQILSQLPVFVGLKSPSVSVFYGSVYQMMNQGIICLDQVRILIQQVL